MILNQLEIKKNYLIGEMKTMSIWRNQPLEHVIIPKPFITPKKEDFIIELTLELS